MRRSMANCTVMLVCMGQCNSSKSFVLPWDVIHLHQQQRSKNSCLLPFTRNRSKVMWGLVFSLLFFLSNTKENMFLHSSLIPSSELLLFLHLSLSTCSDKILFSSEWFAEFWSCFFPVHCTQIWRSQEGGKAERCYFCVMMSRIISEYLPTSVNGNTPLRLKKAIMKIHSICVIFSVLTLQLETTLYFCCVHQYGFIHVSLVHFIQT